MVAIFTRLRHSHEPPGGVDASDAILVSRALREREAFAALYLRYVDEMSRFCLLRLHDEDAARDATQQIFAQALAGLAQYRETGQFRAWLYTIARHVLANQARRRHVTFTLEAALEAVDPGLTPEETATATLEQHALLAAVSRLPDDQRTAVRAAPGRIDRSRDRRGHGAQPRRGQETATARLAAASRRPGDQTPTRRRCAVERDERDRADALDRHWDALLRGEATSATADLDADLATLVARLHAAGSAIPTLFPDRDQAWRELRQERRRPRSPWSDGETTPPTWPYPNGHAESLRRAAVGNLSAAASGPLGPHPAGDSRFAAAHAGGRVRGDQAARARGAG